MEVLDLIYKKLESLERKVDNHSEQLSGLKIKVYTIFGVASALVIIVNLVNKML